MNLPTIAPGTILLAEPFMMDPSFKRGVVLICEERVDGTVGFILNKKIDIKLEEIMSNFPEIKTDIYYGGPVATDTIHFLHNVGDLIDESTEISRGVYWGGDFEKLRFLVETKVVKPHNVRFFIGYSGWSEGQLKEELASGSWIVDDMDANYAFRDKGVDLWQRILNNKGDAYSVISQMPDDPRYN